MRPSTQATPEDRWSKGELVGMNSAIIAPSGGNVGIGSIGHNSSL